MMSNLYDIHMKYVAELINSGEKILLPKNSPPTGKTLGYIKNIKEFYVGFIDKNDDGSFVVYKDFYTCYDNIKLVDMGLCDSNYFYELLDIEKDPKYKKQNEEDKTENIIKIAETIIPPLMEYFKFKTPKEQWSNRMVTMSILIMITSLAFFKLIDGSSTTGLIGVIIGYVFSKLYQRD